jgi:hypothetical protein
MKSILILILSFGLSIIHSNAQDRLIEIKAGGSVPISTAIIESGFDSGYAGIGYAIEGHYYIKPKIAIGVFYSRSADSFDSGEVYISDQNNSEMGGTYKFLSYGVSGKVSTNRSRFFQAYAIARFYQVQNVYDFEDELGFTIGDKGLAGGIGLGIVLKISRTFAFNLFEVNYNNYLSGMEFTKETFSPAEFEIKSGFVFNFKERK